LVPGVAGDMVPEVKTKIEFTDAGNACRLFADWENMSEERMNRIVDEKALVRVNRMESEALFGKILSDEQRKASITDIIRKPDDDEFPGVKVSFKERESSAIAIGVVGVSDEVAARINRKVSGIKVVALNESTEEKNLRALEKIRLEAGAYAQGVIEKEGLTENEVLIAVEELVRAIEEEDKKLFTLTNPELTRLDGQTVKKIADIENVLERIKNRFPIIKSLKTSELSVYNLRIANYAGRITISPLTGQVKDYLSKEEGGNIISVRAKSAGEAKFLAEVHKKRMEQAGYSAPEGCPVKLQVRLSGKEAMGKTGRELAEMMEIDKLCELVVDDKTAKEVFEELRSQQYSSERIVIIDEYSEARKEKGLPEDVIYMEYRDGFASPEAYDLALEVLARKDDQAELERYLKEAGIDSKGGMWFVLPKATRIDPDELKEKLARYREALIRA
ncbi:MAG: hypothetical protein WBD04_06720, partial [Candidatus Omnitrophota bacterium]